jgi:hypothetical protein
MAIVQAELKMYLTGGAANSDPNASLGGAVSSVEVVDNTLNDLWDDITGDQASAGETSYRCIAVKNTNASLTLLNSKFWIQSNTTGGDSIKVGLDLAGLNATPDTTTPETTAPSPAVTFVTAVDKANGLNVGNVPNGQYYGIWIERTVPASTPVFDNSTYILKWEGDTAA